jgi:ArsR family transcriptional regulator, arsenate/arsenite/antimonite-responsive transcriptional repressor
MAAKNARFRLDRFFRAMADATRLRLLNLISGREICVGYFVEILKISQPKVSRHLAYLRRAGIVSTRRDGKWMHYSLKPQEDAIAAGILTETLEHLRARTEMRGDLDRLKALSAHPEKFELLREAPVPREFVPPRDATKSLANTTD